MAYELRGDLEYALHAYWEASTLAEAAGVRYLVVNARCEAAMVRMAQGQLHQALQICHSVIGPMAPEDAAMAPPLGLAHAILGEVWREQNLLTKAEASLLTGIERSQAGGIIDDLRHEFLFLARLRSSQGEYVRAHAALQQIDVILQIYRVPRLSGIVEAHRVRIWLAERRPALAVRWAKAYALRLRGAHPGPRLVGDSSRRRGRGFVGTFAYGSRDRAAGGMRDRMQYTARPCPSGIW
jgi:ATP/maltotriose-dependent transcriptional regulator MalT